MDITSVFGTAILGSNPGGSTERFMNKKQKIMMWSNIFLILPVIFSFIYKENIYFFLALGLFILSPLYHLWSIKKFKNIKIIKYLDWIFAISAFFYMYLYTYLYVVNIYKKYILYILLFFVVVFFWYGWKKGYYEKLHPWFHVVAPIVSSLILIFSKI